ncbi:integrase [Shewanella sp. 10N.286.48.B5]|uniref:integrase n=1 Tax=Shewanella sp. 10N.286.48.B5 TaxID=1880834 RepID=UPI000C842913|nr:integrase [Shewanella sp. 10N.286.48.B5]PMH85265.1 integrase [Shewanella sp. 10N.286.48.B5]
MSDIVQFQPKSVHTAKENLNEFINLCRDELTAFGEECWEGDNWKTFYGKSNKKVNARFSTNTQPSTSYSFEPMADPFIDFAKAYIRYFYSLNPVSNLQRYMEALRGLEESLLSVKGVADITELDGSVLSALTNTLPERYPSTTALNKIGYQLERILDFCRSKQITPSLPEWSNPYSKPKDLTIALDEKGTEYRSNKLPSNEVMMLVSKLFNDAPSLGVEAEYYSAVMALLMVAPSRSSELTVVPVNCLEWEDDRAGKRQLGIRWNPAKGGKAGLKWVPSVMQDVVVEAVARLERIGASARLAAKFAEDNPNVFMRSNHIGEDTALNVQQVNEALSLRLSSLSPSKDKTLWFLKLLETNNGFISYKALGRHEYENYTSKFNNWPYADKKSSVKVSEALLLHRENEFHADFSPRNFSFVLPTVNHINDRFVQSGARGAQSLWSKLNIQQSDGSPISLQSHNARHWLSTMAERGGMDELTLANWAGRAKISDNKHYDHRTESEKSDAARSLLLPEDANALDKINVNLPVSYEDIGRKDMLGIAIVTELGICEHDYSMMPCQRHGDCETCKELVCIKGFVSSLELLKKREKEVEAQFNKAGKDHEMGSFGADRWVSSLGWRLSHIRTKIRLLEDDRVPDGSAIRIPEEFDPSPVKTVLLEKGYDTEVQKSDSITLDDDVYKLLGL